MKDGIKFYGNWERGNSISFTTFVNRSNHPELNGIVPKEHPEDRIKKDDIFYMYYANYLACYTLVVLKTKKDEVLVQYTDTVEYLGRRRWVDRNYLIKERFDYHGRAIMTDNIYSRLLYEHEMYLYRNVEDMVRPYIGKYVEMKKPVEVPIPEVKYRKFPKIHLWV